MLNQITYDETSPLYGYLKEKGLAGVEEAYVATNELTEEIDQGGMEEKGRHEQIVGYGQYYKEVGRMQAVLDLMVGRRMAKQYMIRDGPNTDSYLRDQLKIIALAGILGALFIILSTGLKLALMILAGLAYMLLKTISGSQIVETLQKMGTPNEKLLQSFNKAYKHIKELEFIQRGIVNSFENNIKSKEAVVENVKSLESYERVCVEERQAIGLEMERVIAHILAVISKIAKRHSIYQTKYEFLKNHYKQTCNTGTVIPTLETLRKLLNFLSLARKQLKQILTGILFNPKIRNVDAHQVMHYVFTVDEQQVCAAQSIDLVLLSKQLKHRKQLHSVQSHPTLSVQQSNVCLCIERLSYMKDNLHRFLTQPDPAIKKNILEMTFTELTGVQRLIVPLMEEEHDLADSDEEAARTLEYQDGDHGHQQTQKIQEQDYELVQTADGREKVFKNRQLNKVARELEMLLFKKEVQKEMKYKQEQQQRDQRLKFDFVTQIKHQTDGMILE